MRNAPTTIIANNAIVYFVARLSQRDVKCLFKDYKSELLTDI